MEPPSGHPAQNDAVGAPVTGQQQPRPARLEEQVLQSGDHSFEESSEWFAAREARLGVGGGLEAVGEFRVDGMERHPVDVPNLYLTKLGRRLQRVRPPVAEHDFRRFAGSGQAAVDHSVELHVLQQLAEHRRLLPAGRVQTDAARVRHSRAVGVQVLDRAVAQQVDSATIAGSGQRRHEWFRARPLGTGR